MTEQSEESKPNNNNPLSRDFFKFIRDWWKDKNPVLLFLVGFAIIVSILYLAKIFFGQKILLFLLKINAQIANYLLILIGVDSEVTGTTISVDKFSMNVVNGCDATDAVMIFLAVVLAFPARWKDKLTGSIIGTFFLLSINVLRVFILFLVGVFYPAWFEIMHIEILQFFFILLAIICFAIWIKWTFRRTSN